MFSSLILKFHKIDYLSIKGKQNMTFNLGAVAFSSTHWKSTIKVQDHPAELNICLGHSDSYTGVKQSTLMCQPLTTSGQGKLSFLDPH